MKRLVLDGWEAGTPLNASLQSRRRLLLGMTAITAYIATVLGANTNLIYLCLSACAVAIAWSAITAVRKLRWAFFALIAALLLGIAFNGAVAALRSATPYLSLLAAYALLYQPRADTRGGISQGIALLYGVGALQLATYLIQVALSPHYTFLYSLSEFHRFGIGWISVVCFFHASLPTRKKSGLTSRMRQFGIIFWIVPLLAVLNSSRSELLMVVLVAGISLFLRGRLIFIATVVVATVLLPIFSDDISVIGRVNRSLEETFQGDIEMLHEVHKNYRAFENLMMVERISSSGVIGCGLGCAVPFPFTMTLDGQDYDEIAVFHNGYLTVTLHFGLLGVIIISSLLWQLWKVWSSFVVSYNQNNSSGPASVQSDALRFVVLLLLLGTSLTTGGFMSSQDMLVLLLPLSAAIGISPKSKHAPMLSAANKLRIT